MKLRIALVAAALTASVGSSLRAADTYNASSGAVPSLPFTRFDEQNVFNSFGPYAGKGYTPNPDHSASSVTGIYTRGQTQTDKYTFWYDANNTLNTTANTVQLSAN